MRNIFILLGLVATAFPTFSHGVDFQNISLNEAIAKAKKENKHVFVDCYTSWCSPCKMMDKDVFPTEEMGDYFNPRFVCVKFDMEKGDGPEIAKKFGTRAYPTFIIFDGEGDMLHKFAGADTGTAFIEKVRDSFDPEKALGSLEKRYEAGERGKAFIACYLPVLKRSHDPSAGPRKEEYERSLSDEDLFCKECWFLFDEAGYGSKYTDLLIGNRDRIGEIMGREEVDRMIFSKFEFEYDQLGGARLSEITIEKIDRLAERAKPLGLPDSEALELYEACMRGYLNKSAGEFFTMLQKKAPGISDDSYDTLILRAMMTLGRYLSSEQKEWMAGSARNDPKKETIRNLTGGFK